MRGGCSCEKKNCRIFFETAHNENEFPYNAGKDLQLACKCPKCNDCRMIKPDYDSHIHIWKENLNGDKNQEKNNKCRRK